MLKFKQVMTDDEELIRTMADWYNDETIQHLIKPNLSEGPFEFCTPEDIKESLGLKNKFYFIAYDGALPIGEVSIMIDPGHLARKVPNTAWISIVIGEPSYRGKGYGAKLMSFLEQKALELGLVRIELGVFDFNVTAVEFYKKLGYVPFAEYKDFTYCNGEWHTDIRMEKDL